MIANWHSALHLDNKPLMNTQCSTLCWNNITQEQTFWLLKIEDSILHTRGVLLGINAASCLKYIYIIYMQYANRSFKRVSEQECFTASSNTYNLCSPDTKLPPKDNAYSLLISLDKCGNLNSYANNFSQEHQQTSFTSPELTVSPIALLSFYLGVHNIKWQ